MDDGTEYREVGISSFGRGTFHKPALSGLEVGSKKLYWIKRDDLLFHNVFAWEGAIAVATAGDDRRVGSHRYISCVAEPEVTTSNFLKFYFLTKPGLAQINIASPGGAGRNRTLGLKKLEQIKVPVPEFEQQRRFDDLQADIARILDAQEVTLGELDALLPSILDRVFKGEL